MNADVSNWVDFGTSAEGLSIAALTCFTIAVHNCGMKYGYARTSTDDQTTALQLAALKRARCAHVFEDKGVTGATIKRPALSCCLKTLRAGDTLIVWKIAWPAACAT
jgi:hypothetical protein